MFDFLTTLTTSLTAHLTLAGVGSSLALCMMIAALALLMWKVSKDDSNDLSCWQLIASRGVDGKQFMDPKKIGYMLGSFGGFWVIVKSTYAPTGIAPEIFALWLSFLAGIDIITTITKGKQNLPTPDTTTTTTDGKTNG